VYHCGSPESMYHPPPAIAANSPTAQPITVRRRAVAASLRPDATRSATITAIAAPIAHGRKRA